MSRQANKVGSVRITITTTQSVKGYLEQLVEMGIYGRNPAEVAERLICENLRNDLKRKRITALEGAK